MRNFLLLLWSLLGVLPLLFAQEMSEYTSIEAYLYPNHSEGSLEIQSTVRLKNSDFINNDTLYLYDWNHAFSSKNSSLGRAFQQRFDRSFHWAREDERGYTTDLEILLNGEPLPYERIDYDVLKLIIQGTGEDFTLLELNYSLKLPSSKFTGYGINEQGTLVLKNNLILPIPLENGSSRVYHHQNKINQRTGLVAYTIRFDRGDNHFIHSDLSPISYFDFQGIAASPPLFIIDHDDTSLIHYRTSEWSIHLDDELIKGLSEPKPHLSRIIDFVEDYLPGTETDNMVLTVNEYNEAPISLIADIPALLSPYPEGFIVEFKLVKTLLRKQLLLKFDSNMSEEHFYLDGFVQYLLERYIETYYPGIKLIGKFNRLWPLNRYTLGEIQLKDYFKWLARFIDNRNLDQPLLTSTSALLNYNYSIANPVRAAQLFHMSFNPQTSPESSAALLDFQRASALTPGVSGFDLKWFFNPQSTVPVVSERLLQNRQRIDFKFTDFKRAKNKDSILLHYNGAYPLPVKVSQYVGDQEVDSKWISNENHETWVSFDTQKRSRYIVNPELESPEFTTINNTYNPRGGILKKPIKILPITDLDDLRYSQLFVTPQVLFNIYDGISLGAQLSNNTLVTKPFEYELSPYYSRKEKALIGAFKFSSNFWVNDKNRSRISAGIFGLSQHFDINSRYSTVTPYVAISQNVSGITSRTNQSFLARLRSVSRSIDENSIETQPLDNPDYVVFNLRYQKTKQSLFDYRSLLGDLQLTPEFIKLSSSTEYRKLFDNNTQLSFRLYGGVFLRNIQSNGYFDFSIGRPNDYLYDYSLIGRSESEGLSAQQLIRGEGGFVSSVDQGFSNGAIAASNVAVNLWRFIEVYTELGYLKNKGEKARYLYGSGLRLNLVPDYLEVYLPVHNHTGFEAFDKDYSSKIRFVLSLEIETLSRLFTRSLF